MSSEFLVRLETRLLTYMGIWMVTEKLLGLREAPYITDAVIFLILLFIAYRKEKARDG